MQRRAALAVVAMLAAWPGVHAQQPVGRVHRLGILHPGTFSAGDPVQATTFTAPLRELGYIEGRNLVIERRYAQDRPERLPALARELVALQVDVILAVATSAAKAAKEATTAIPIVLLNNGDPVALGLVPNLARTGSNLTGVLIAPEGSLAGKRVELLREFVPRATRIALLVPGGPSAAQQLQVDETRAAATSLGLEMDLVEVKGGDYARAFAALAATHSQGVVVGANPFFLRDRKLIIELAARHRVPAIYEWPRQVRDGGLMSYGPSDDETYRQVASYIDRILKGAKPGDLPIWQPSKLYLVINRGVARALGVALPQSLLLRADEVIE